MSQPARPKNTKATPTLSNDNATIPVATRPVARLIKSVVLSEWPCRLRRHCSEAHKTPDPFTDSAIQQSNHPVAGGHPVKT